MSIITISIPPGQQSATAKFDWGLLKIVTLGAAGFVRFAFPDGQRIIPDLLFAFPGTLFPEISLGPGIVTVELHQPYAVPALCEMLFED